MNSVVQMYILAQKVHELPTADKVYHRRNFLTPHVFIKLFPLAVRYWLLSEMSYWIEGLLVWITPVVLMLNVFACECYSVVIIDFHLHFWAAKLWFGNSIQIQIVHSQECLKLIVVPSSSSQRYSHCCQSSEDNVDTTPKKLNPENWILLLLVMISRISYLQYLRT